MMQKNEFHLFPIWIKYHGELIGYENIYVFDNGSNDFMKTHLVEAEKRGVNLDYSKSSSEDFQNKGVIISDKIKELDKSGEPFDFYFPMDCDEFLAVQEGYGQLKYSWTEINRELETYIGSPHILMIHHGYDNHPTNKLLFGLKGRKKVFFAQGSCKLLTLGFHSAKAYASDTQIKTNIVYLHIHNKPIELLKSSSIQKLLPRVKNFLVPTLLDHSEKKLRGYHLINHLFLLGDIEYEREFESKFKKDSVFSLPEFYVALEKIGISEFFSDNRSGSAAIDLDDDYDIEMMHFRFGNQKLSDNAINVSESFKFNDKDGYGWVSITRGLKDIARDGSNSILRHITIGKSPATFRFLIPPGKYLIKIICGDLKGVERVTAIEVIGVNDCKVEITTIKNRFAEASIIVETKSGFIDINLSSPKDIWVLHSLKLYFTRKNPSTQVKYFRVVNDRWVSMTSSTNTPKQMIDQWLQENLNAQVNKTNIDRTEYLSTIESCVDFFRTHQNAHGAIIDPYLETEFQYATPCYAFSSALVAKYKNRKDLILSSVQAFRKAANDLANRNAANGHEDFYPSPLAHAYRILKDLISSDDLESISRPLTTFDPYTTYRKPPGGRGGSGSNWNCKALAGHQLLINLGLKNTQIDYEYVADSLLGQGWLFTCEYGTYMEGPSTYDSFPRAWLSDMLEWGYCGPKSEELSDMLERGAITSLFLQSPNGELVHGGRSSLHQWADALQCLIFEIYSARAFRSGNVRLAGVYKRAARKSLSAVNQWKRPSGELWIIKNRFDPSLSHGYEVYSSHSQYNLLAMTALGYAYEHSEHTDFVEEQTIPAEAGSYLLKLPSPLDTLVGTLNGVQVVHLLAPKPHQNLMGLLKISMNGVPYPLLISDNIPKKTNFLMPEMPGFNVSCGLYWSNSSREISDPEFFNEVRSVSDLYTMGVHPPDVVINNNSKNVLDYEITYNMDKQISDFECIKENVIIEEGSVQINYRRTACKDNAFIIIPILDFDGVNSTLLSESGGSVTVNYNGSCVVFSSANTYGLVATRCNIYMRSGRYKIFVAQGLPDCCELTLKMFQVL